MSTTIAPPSDEAARRRASEARLVVPDVSWRVYETWVDSLPESTPVLERLSAWLRNEWKKPS